MKSTTQKKRMRGWTLTNKLAAIVADALPDKNGCLIAQNIFMSTKGYPVINHQHKTYNIVRLLLIDAGVNMTGLVTRHKCNNSMCINITHIEPGTHLQNSKQDRHRDGAYFLSVLDVDVIRSYASETNMSYEVIGRMFEINKSAVSQIATRQLYDYNDYGLPHYRRVRQPHTGRRFTDDQIRAIKAQAAQGVKQSVLARLYVVPHQTINAIIQRKAYKDVQ